MNRLTLKLQQIQRRKRRVRSQVSGTPSRPRLSVYISNHHVSAQLIDDTTGHTLASITTVGAKVTGTITEKATWAGSEIAKRAKTAKVKSIVLDRNGRRYHGRVHAFAEAARKEGLEF